MANLIYRKITRFSFYTQSKILPRTAYPDFTITLDEVIYAKDKVAVRWTIHATNTGPGSHPPTGKAVSVPGMSILHVASGKIVDEWIASNDLYWMQQLGFEIVPPKSSKELSEPR
ncbi:MAG: ester cyclase [Bacteroidota bacterium]